VGKNAVVVVFDGVIVQINTILGLLIDYDS